jgi:hypothetical protein
MTEFSSESDAPALVERLPSPSVAGNTLRLSLSRMLTSQVSASRYVPPALRAKQLLDGSAEESEEVLKLKRHLKGLLNRQVPLLGSDYLLN